MAILRTRNRLLSSAPPPSPIATAKGLKSAAVDDQILSEYLEKTLQIPDLTLPESYFPANAHSQIPAKIDFSSLLSGNEDSVRQLLESAVDFGVFRIIGHGISADELQSTVAEAEWAFRISTEKNKDLNGNFGFEKDIREEFFWFRSGKATVETLQEEIGPERYRRFCKKMENIYGTLETVSENVGQILSKYMRKPDRKRIQEREPVLCLYHRYNHDHLEDPHPPSDGHDKNVVDSSDHALTLYLSNGDREFHIQSQKGLLSFNTGAGTIVVTIGKQLEEWSHGELKCVSGEPILEPSINGNTSYSIKFMCSPLTLNDDLNQMTKTISVVDQILIALIIALLYNFLTYISSRFTQK